MRLLSIAMNEETKGENTQRIKHYGDDQTKRVPRIIDPSKSEEQNGKKRT
jgi:hypothetical protein